MKREMVQPEMLGEPVGLYSHVCLTDATQYAFIAGQLAVARDGQVVGVGDFERQMRQCFSNLECSVGAAGGSMNSIVKMTTYLVRSQYITPFYELREELFAAYFPASDFPPNTLLIVDRLVREEFLIEIEAIAAIA